MHISERLIGCVAKRIMDKNIDTVEIDWNKLLYNILFAEHFVLDSIRLREIPFLVRRFGYLEVRNLLLSNIISVRSDTYNLGILIENPKHKFHYPIIGFDVDNRNQYLQGCLNEIGFKDDLEGYIREIDRIELVNMVQNKILPTPKDPLKKFYDSFSHELNSDNLSLKMLMQLELLAITKKQIPLEKIYLSVKMLEQNVCKIENNISNFSVSSNIAHGLIGKCISLLSRKHLRLFKMENDQALGCYSEQEQYVVENSLRFLTRQLNLENHIKASQRIIEIAGLPQLANSDKLKISRLIEIRDTTEWREFRTWISNVIDWSDEEIRKELQHRSSKLFALAGGVTGKMIGRIINLAALFAEPVTAAAIEFFPWLVKKVTNQKGHIVFLYRDYPTIFEQF